MNEYKAIFSNIINNSLVSLSSISPSEWTEKNMIMGEPFPGPFKYDRTPYTREIIDCFDPNHPARIIAVMKGAQVGFSSGVIYPAIGWIIKNQPGNILFMVGHDDLVDESMNKVDQMIDSTGIRNLIRPSVRRNKAGKTGDTNRKKEFSNYYLVAGSANNHKVIRQRDIKYGFIDDFEAVKRSSKESGNSRKLIEQRFAAYANKMKLAYISTPERDSTSNIKPAYLLGDQRKFMVPCPCCGEYINLEWSIVIEDQTAGITWQLDENSKIIPGSVGYICQKCFGFFDDSNKHDILNNGYWQPTAEPSRKGYFSYHLSSLYAPAGMYDWEHYVRDYLDANPPGGKRDEGLHKAFMNLCLGETYEEATEEIKANHLQKNVRNYPIRLVPERISEKEGNGKIVLITMACDLNGTMDDARLDYEVVAWSETGSTYSITHGSIGTFIPREGTKKIKEDREKWSYEHNHVRSVWPEVSKLIGKTYQTDTDRTMEVFITGIDSGHFTVQTYAFIDKCNSARVIGVKGAPDKAIQIGLDIKLFKPAKERKLLYILEVGNIKDELAKLISLKYDDRNDDIQPPGFMNFPTPSEGQYNFKNYFEHYEAEHRVPEMKNGEVVAMKWEKKNSAVQNHFFDVRIYNMAVRDIFIDMVGRDLKRKNFTWSDYVDVILKRV